MNFKFKLEGINVSVPENDMTPEINFELKGLSYEVEDLSITEYAQVVKLLTSEIINHVKDINKAQEEEAERSFQRDKERHEMFLQEHNAKTQNDDATRQMSKRAQTVLEELERKIAKHY